MLTLSDDKLVGEVRLNDLLKLRSRQEKSIETIVRTEVHSVLEDTVLEAVELYNAFSFFCRST